MNDSAGHACLLKFDTEDAEFARGFEAGRLWALLRATDDQVVEAVQAANTVVIEISSFPNAVLPRTASTPSTGRALRGKMLAFAFFLFCPHGIGDGGQSS
jgi:hypothetical protein